MSGRNSDGSDGAWPVVPLADQALYLAHTAAGHEAVIQILWIYRHAVNLDGLRRFKSHLKQGLLARVIRPSLLPGGRHHWVAAPSSSSDSDLAVGSQPLSRGDLHAWADAQVQLPLDPARGPAWHLSVQPVTDGSTAVSLVVSHCIADGMATIMAVCEAVRGERRPLGELQPRGRAASLAREVRQLLLDGPTTMRALARLAATGLGTIDLRRIRSGWRRPVRRARKTPSHGSTEPAPRVDRPVDHPDAVALPSVSIGIPSSIWSARVKRAGVSDSALLTAMAAALGARLGRVRDGAVLIMFPVSLRSGSTLRSGSIDSGGNRVSIATLPVNVETLSGPLKDIQRGLLGKVRATRRGPGGLEALLPLIPFVPRALVAAGSNRAFGFSANVPVTCSYLGTFPPDVLRIDDTAAGEFTFRGVDRHLSERSLERRGGVATLLAGFVGDAMVLNFVAWQSGAVTDSARLQTIAEQILADYELRGEVLL